MASPISETFTPPALTHEVFALDPLGALSGPHTPRRNPKCSSYAPDHRLEPDVRLTCSFPILQNRYQITKPGNTT